ncbi:MAG: YicC family protein [Lentisphaerae bacterium]|nr:YicC family protein [Lentisphaerota bacterium]
MKSMTGYGRATASADGNQVTVEVSAVNSRKQVDMRFAIPRELGMLEPVLRQQIQERLSRGSLQVALSYVLNPAARKEMAQIDMDVACHIADNLREVAQKTGIAGEVTLQDILLVPGVVVEATSSPYEPLKELAVAALKDALAALDDMRSREGAKLQEDLLVRRQTMIELVDKIAARGDEALILQKQRLRERIAVLGVELTLDDERLTKELAFFAERADITEEIVRLRSHLDQYGELLVSDSDPGRNLDFLGQEMNREVNTLAAKTADLSISNWALALKAELARIREQIMNIE